MTISRRTFVAAAVATAFPPSVLAAAPDVLTLADIRRVVERLNAANRPQTLYGIDLGQGQAAYVYHADGRIEILESNYAPQ